MCDCEQGTCPGNCPCGCQHTADYRALRDAALRRINELGDQAWHFAGAPDRKRMLNLLAVLRDGVEKAAKACEEHKNAGPCCDWDECPRPDVCDEDGQKFPCAAFSYALDHLTKASQL